MQAIAKALQISGQPGLSRAISVVALPAAVAADRGDGRDVTAALALEIIGGHVQNRDGRREVDIDGASRLVEIILRQVLFGQVSVAQNHAVQVAVAMFQALGKRGRMTLEVQCVERVHRDLRPVPHFQVGGHGLGFRKIPGRQHQPTFAPSEDRA